MAFVTRPAPSGGRVTTDEFLAGPERPGVLLIDGEVFMNEATPLHQKQCGRIYNALHLWTIGSGHGEIGWSGNWVLSADTVVKPDVWWMADPSTKETARGYDGPPDLAIEVLSPSTRHLDLGRKGERYRDAGLVELWLVDVRKHRVLVRRLAAGITEELGSGDVLTSPQLPGFALSVDELFDGLG